MATLASTMPPRSCSARAADECGCAEVDKNTGRDARSDGCRALWYSPSRRCGRADASRARLGGDDGASAASVMLVGTVAAARAMARIGNLMARRSGREAPSPGCGSVSGACAALLQLGARGASTVVLLESRMAGRRGLLERCEVASVRVIPTRVPTSAPNDTTASKRSLYIEARKRSARSCGGRDW